MTASTDTRTLAKVRKIDGRDRYYIEYKPEGQRIWPYVTSIPGGYLSREAAKTAIAKEGWTYVTRWS